MDYSELDIYSKDKFILRSVARQKQFPFIKYNGNNYEELASFITSASPNTKIPGPDELKKGELYTFSGKSFRLVRVPIESLRFVIASNPYLVRSKGQSVPLAINTHQATEYLKESNRHKVFAYEEVLSTYQFNQERSSFVMYDSSHPSGIPINALPEHAEWYIGGNEGLHRKIKYREVFYQKALHIVDARPSFAEIEDRIESLKYEINRLLHVKGYPVMFNVDWGYYVRRKELKTTSLNERNFISFVRTLYYAVYEETKGPNQSSLETLGDFANHPFVQVVASLNNYYNNGLRTPVESSTDGYSIVQVFQKFLKQDMGPQEADDYSFLQQGILEDYQHFLESLFESLKARMRIIGTICQDEFDNIYCGKALLGKKYTYYLGCECIITSYITNLDDRTSQYPFYCDKIDSIAINRTGTIRKDKNGAIYLDRFVFSGSDSEHIGKKARIEKVSPFYQIRDGYLGKVLSFVLLDEKTEMPSLGEVPPENNLDPYIIPSDVFDENKRVHDDSLFVHKLVAVVTSGEGAISRFQKLFNFILKWGKIENKAEQDAMLTLLTGYYIRGAASKARWCCDETPPRVLYHIVKHISDSREKYQPLKSVDFYCTNESLKNTIKADLNTIWGSNTSKSVDERIPSEIRSALWGCYKTLFPKPKE